MAPSYPSDWDDDERMSFLFSAFRATRDVDSADWDSKMTFWIPLILQHAKSQGSVSVTLHQLQSHFIRKGSTPLGLAVVIQEMLRRGCLHQESDFVSGVSSGWISWGMRQVVIKPLQWTLGTILGGKMNPDEPFVIPDALKERAELLLRIFQSSPLSSTSLLLEDEVYTLCKDHFPDRSAFNLILLQLQRDKKICVLQRHGEKFVKFVRGGRTQVTPIGESDFGIYELHKSQKLLSERVQRASDESDRLKEEAISFKRAGNKQQAVRCMRRRKLSERRLSEVQNKLDTVQSILERISMAETDRMVISAYQMGVTALRTTLKDVSLEKTECLVDQIQEFCDLQDDVSQTLAGAVPGDIDVDADELERELNEILQENDTDLPDVPTGPLTSPQRLPAVHNSGAFDMGDMVINLPDVPRVPGAVPRVPGAVSPDRNSAFETSRMAVDVSGAPTNLYTSPRTSSTVPRVPVTFSPEKARVFDILQPLSSHFLSKCIGCTSFLKVAFLMMTKAEHVCVMSIHTAAYCHLKSRCGFSIALPCCDHVPSHCYAFVAGKYVNVRDFIKVLWTKRIGDEHARWHAEFATDSKDFNGWCRITLKGSRD
ncbi:PREDICTED: charged multivesicular body protein 7 [Nanorana parkeri]|uniref:charged multivesicular body protein 7 n=1 Tax=Nanorana parkeri TaxID=125878 RepID=UPI000853FE5F|nr:PREDICTED: charged multivesicular body protein 7 [Nanorana parkeri]